MSDQPKIMCRCGHPLMQHANGTCTPSRPGFCTCSSPQWMDEERIARETAQGMAKDLAAMVATNAALLSKRSNDG